jgi:stage II sporulation protein D
MAVAVAWPDAGSLAPQVPDLVEPLEPPPIRDVRVLLARTDQVQIRSSVGLAVGDAGRRVVSRTEPGEWATVAVDEDGRLTVDGRAAAQEHLRVEPERAATLFVRLPDDGGWADPREYFGRIEVLPRDAARIAVINHVDVEHYVACVTANEVWPTFEQEALRGQAIAARSYVVYQMTRRNAADFDVSATQGSQVYRGLRRDRIGQRAARATQHTRGIVLSYNDGDRDRLFCAYYSAACGGMSQSAAIFGVEGDVEPLAGGVACDYCRIAPGETYRWGPVTLKKRDLQDQLVTRYPELEDLGDLRRVEVAETTTTGRAVSIRLTGSIGQTHELLAERFRHAVDPMTLRSTHFQIRDEGTEVVFEDGRGFGHGLGLCQWGMQGQAKEGRRADEILTYYFRSARLTRVY